MTHILVTLLVSASLLVSSGGYVICVGSDGRTALEAANPLIGCQSDACERGNSQGLELRFAESSECVDLFVSGFLTIRPDRADGKDLTATPDVSFQQPFAAGMHACSIGMKLAAETHLPDSQSVAVIRSTILLV